MRRSYDLPYHPGEEGLKSLSYTGSAEEVPNSNTEDQTHQICTVVISIVLVGREEGKKEGEKEGREEEHYGLECQTMCHRPCSEETAAWHRDTFLLPQA